MGDEGREAKKKKLRGRIRREERSHNNLNGRRDEDSTDDLEKFQHFSMIVCVKLFVAL